MRLLLDTHSLLWFLMGDRQLSARARRTIEFARNDVFVSVASGYELAFKSYRRNVVFSLDRDLAAEIESANFSVLPIRLDHAIAAGQLGGIHGDPWDRVIIAQSRVENLILVTRDETFPKYGVRTLW